MPSKDVDTLWEFLHALFNSPRCKTAILILTIIVGIVFAIQEAQAGSTTAVQTTLATLIGFWIARATAKNKV